MTTSKHSADVIIVGAGTSGSAVVRRLVDAGLRVTVIEAGPPDDHEALHDPAGNIVELMGTEYNWAYEYVPQSHANGRVIAQPKGRTLGGSSAINGLVYVRGHAADYDEWASLGASGWDWASVEPYYRRLENYSEKSAGRGIDGPIGVLLAPKVSPLVEAWIEACGEAGFPSTDDYNLGDMIGAARAQLNVQNGRRSSSWVGYVRPIEENPLLTVLTRSMVTNLVFEGNRVVGVEYVDDKDRGGATTRLTAEQEVVLSAGSIASPQLLMLSGIGDPAELKRLGIPVRVELPGVGKNLQDHTLTSIIFETNEPVPPPGTSMNEGLMFFRTRPDLAAPDIQAQLFAFPYPSGEGAVPQNGFTILSMVMHPASRGSLTLRSTDPFDKPLIDPQYLAEPQDLETFVDSVGPIRDIASQPAIRGFIKGEAQPGPGVTTREQLREFGRSWLSSPAHPIGTTKMGVDNLAVVDPELRVNGVQGLRVADLSVAPTLTTGNTNGPALMIGERAADFILGKSAS